MGNRTSNKKKHQLEQEDISGSLQEVQDERQEVRQLATITHFDENTIDQLRNLFDDLSAINTDDCLIDLDEFASALGLNSTCFILKRIFQRFDLTKTSTLNFREFVVSLSDLSLEATRKQKVKFSFELYDLNHDGTIDLSELQLLLQAALASGRDSLMLTEAQIEHICQSTVADMDKDGNGVIDFHEYERMVEENPALLDVFTIDIQQVLQAREARIKQEKPRPSPTLISTMASPKIKKKEQSSMFSCTRKPKKIQAFPVNDVESLF